MSNLRRLLCACLASLLALQPIGAVAPQCRIAGWISGSSACCCAEPASQAAEDALSCCSRVESETPTDGTGLSEVANRCDCAVDVPAPSGALPHDAEARAGKGSAPALDTWIAEGAGISAITEILSTSSPPGEGCAATGVRRPHPRAPVPSLARGPRGLLAVTCVALC